MYFCINNKTIEVNSNLAGGIQLFNLTDKKHYYLSSEECKGFLEYCLDKLETHTKEELFVKTIIHGLDDND